jgi:SAM-dependent methyltransferase
MTDVGRAAAFDAAAEAYDRHIGRYGPGLARALCDTAGVRSGDRALDVGCGPGALAKELVARLRAEHVAAVDPSPTLADGCRRRLPGVQVEGASAERLPFGDAVFDHALAQLVVNFMTDARAGVREMVRVTKHGGTVDAAVWDYADGMTLLRCFWDAAVALDPAARERDEARSMAYCTPGELEALWEDAGLAAIEVFPAIACADYAGFDDLWHGLEAGVGPSGAYVAALAPDRRAGLRDELRRRLGHAGDEPFRLTARAWIVSGQVR